MKNWIKILCLIYLMLFSVENNAYIFAREKYKNANSLSSYEINEIKSIEIILFGFSFDNEPIEKRLERLELKVFNMVSTDNYKNRITALKTSLNGSHNYSTYTTVQPYYQYGTNYPIFNNFAPYPYRRPLHNHHTFRTKINALRNLKSYLNGTMTGYTLPIQNNSYNGYGMPGNNKFYSNGGMIQEYSGNGYSYRNINTNDGGINVKILD